MSGELWVVRNGHGKVGAEDAVVFDDNNYRIDYVEFFPHPVIVSINVNAQKPDLSTEAGIAQEIVDVVTSNPRLLRRERVPPVNFVTSDLVDPFLI